ncbi:disease resistance protein RPM1-like [Magnolia sinica]|uniref:disease resistance protein RPM1-like n=1 Tax=Magnolia sinica TaxID=86752 RepID=UPI00265A7BE0|nr:disease resistance protein RPM1-like [Magnolia sinica]
MYNIQLNTPGPPQRTIWIDCLFLSRVTEAMADSVVGFLLEKLSALLIQEASLLRGVRTEVEEIKLELNSMQAFLRDADRRKDSSEEMKTWVGQVRDAAHDVEDIVDEFVYCMDRRRRSGFRGFLLNIILLPENISYRHRLATQLQGLQSNFAAISLRKDRYHLSMTAEGLNLYNASGRWQHHGETSLFSVDDDEIVGLKERIDRLVGWLTEKEPKRTIISVAGMGGLGKTTLVAKVYKNRIVRKHFDYSVWVSVSQSYRVEELLIGVIKDLFQASNVEVPSDVGSMNRRQLVQMVNDFLDTKRYIVVLDDVWSIDAWADINIAFPRNRCGSRIMLTTRHENVGFALGDGSHPFLLEPLQEKEAWELFIRKAFWKEPCPPELQHLAKKIVVKCGGLPLAIVALGSLLSLKDKTILEWNRIYENLSWQFRNDQILERMKRTLLLSFYDLPYRLKHCFLYCCMFPEDYLIHRKRLIRLWVAEGFVEERGKITMEAAAEDFLKELIYRNMLQVVETNLFGRVKTCRMHDIVREVALSLCDEEKFCMTYDEQQARQEGKVRRMSIYNSGETIQGMPRLRSLLVFDGSTSFSSSLNTIASSFILLRVLNLEGVPIESIPDEMTNLFNLRYLNLRNTNVRELPKSLGKLQNLQTLDVRDTRIKRLPSGIVKLQKLRHLFYYGIYYEHARSFHCFSSIQVPIGICNITSLQSLEDIEVKEGEIVRKLGNLTQLRRLSISEVREIDGAELCASIGKMKHLLKLFVTATGEEETLQLEALSPNPPPLLQKLCLNGHLKKVPQWISSLMNLTYLELKWSKLREEDLLSSLHALPNLVFLSLDQAYEGQQLCFRNGRFPKLRILYLVGLPQLNQVVIEKGALPSIQEVNLFSCGELKTLPQGIEYLTGLQELHLQDMPMELRLQIKDGSEEDRRKVGHIPFIKLWTEEGWVLERLN